MQGQAEYDELIKRWKEIALLNSCGSLLSWEEQTYMPPAGIEHRGNQMAFLAGLAHEKRTDSRIGELIDAVDDSSLVGDPLSVPAANIREIRRVFDRARKLPQSLVEEIACTTTLAQRQWAEARKKSDFAAFRPWLEKIIALKRLEADALGYDTVPYDALLDEYEPGARSSEIAEVFAKIRDNLVSLVAAIGDSSRKPNSALLRREYPIDRQRWFGESAAAAIGFDFQAGRIDTTAHPFCSTIGPGDCRLTTRFNANYFNDGFFSILHECGHGMYEQGLEREHFGTPMGEAVSLGIHESQSRLWENAVGRSVPFWKHFFPRAKQVFHEALHDTSLEDFHFAVNSVQPSFIRVDADEATYNLHILIRFELEQDLISGNLKPDDVPPAWNDRYTKYLCITPANDAQGCLQDIHWSAGLVGYFPTYTLGNLYAAQFFDRAKRDLGDLAPAFERGDFAPLLEWLRTKIHRHGQRYRPKQLVEAVTCEPPSHEPLINSLKEKYGPLYDLRLL